MIVELPRDVEVLSEALGVPKSAIELLSGETSPRKRFVVIGANVDEIRESLTRVIAES